MKIFSFANIGLITAILLVGCAKKTSEPATPPSLTEGGPVSTELQPDAGWTCPGDPSPAWGGAGVGDPYSPLWGNGGYDVSHYDINLNVDVVENYVRGETIVTAKSIQELDAFNLDFLGMEISNILLDGDAAEFCRDDEGELTIIPARPLAKGERFTTSVTYHGTPVIIESDFGFYGWFMVDSGVLTSGPPNDPAYLYPNNEYISNLATYTISVTVSSEYQVSSVGLLKETIGENGQVTTVWDLTVPSSFIGLSISRDVSVDTLEGPNGLPIRFQYPTALEDYFEETILDLPELLDFFVSLYGPFPYNRLGITVVNNRAIQMSMPTLVFTRSADVEELTAHEIAHQWIGQNIRPRRDKSSPNWLFEGLATYSTFLWLEHQGQSADDLIRTTYLELPNNTQPPGFDYGPTELGDAVWDVVYNRPCTAFHALRKRVGDDAFFTILSTFTARFKGGFANANDFISVVEEASGQDLTTFFDEWLYQEPVPDIPELKLSKG